MKQELMRKLSSRKFWAAVVSFVSAIMMAFNFGENDVAQVAAIIMAGGSLISYIFAEGWVDANRSGGDTDD